MLLSHKCKGDFDDPARRARMSTMSCDLPEHTTSYGSQPWERWPRENENDWFYFRTYRDSAYPKGYEGPFQARDVSAVALAVGATTGILKARIASYAWNERCAAFDTYLERVRIEAGATQLQRITYAHLRLQDQLRLFLEQEIAHLRTQQESGVHLTPNELIKFHETVLKYDRLAMGQSTENVAISHTWNVDALSIEEIETLRELAAKGYQAPQKVLAPDTGDGSE